MMRWMTRQRPTQTKAQRSGRARARTEITAVVTALRKAREEAGLSQRGLAAAAGLGPSAVREVEDAKHEPTIGVLARIAAALGGEVAVRYYPGSGPPIRDRLQTPMIDALVARLDPRWTVSTEVWVTEPIKGVIDLLLTAPSEPTVVSEAHSRFGRVEQQVRWLHAKAQAVAGRGHTAPSSLLLLRDHPTTRAVAIQYADYLATAFPARHRNAVAALTGQAPWPGAAVVWMKAAGGHAAILDEPPKGVVVGR